MQSDSLEPKAAFGNIYPFSKDDLRSNQNGFVGVGHKAWMEAMARGVVRMSWLGLPIAVFFVLLGSALIIALFLQNSDSREVFFSGPGVILGLMASCVVVLLLVGLGIFMARRQAERMHNPELRAVQGAASSRPDYSAEGVTTYHLQIGQQKLPFGDAPSSIFKEGEAYRLYFCQVGYFHLILSYERIGA